jgi:hypothetical protein
MNILLSISPGSTGKQSGVPEAQRSDILTLWHCYPLRLTNKLSFSSDESTKRKLRLVIFIVLSRFYEHVTIRWGLGLDLLHLHTQLVTTINTETSIICTLYSSPL